MIYLQLFLSFLQIGALSFGGGYAAMPLIENQVVTLHGWMNAAEFVDLVTISEMTPGPIAVNSATFVGIKVAGPAGALVATFGCILPACIIVSLLAYLYLKYRKLEMFQRILLALRPAVVAMIATAGVRILKTAFWQGRDWIACFTDIRIRAVFIFVVCIILLKKWKINPVFVMLLSGVLEGGFRLLSVI